VLIWYDKNLKIKEVAWLACTLGAEHITSNIPSSIDEIPGRTFEIVSA
jgi:hypothetical protein